MSFSFWCVRFLVWTLTCQLLIAAMRDAIQYSTSSFCHARLACWQYTILRVARVGIHYSCGQMLSLYVCILCIDASCTVCSCAACVGFCGDNVFCCGAKEKYLTSANLTFICCVTNLLLQPVLDTAQSVLNEETFSSVAGGFVPLHMKLHRWKELEAWSTDLSSALICQDRCVCFATWGCSRLARQALHRAKQVTLSVGDGATTGNTLRSYCCSLYLPPYQGQQC